MVVDHHWVCYGIKFHSSSIATSSCLPLPRVWAWALRQVLRWNKWISQGCFIKLHPLYILTMDLCFPMCSSRFSSMISFPSFFFFSLKAWGKMISSVGDNPTLIVNGFGSLVNSYWLSPDFSFSLPRLDPRSSWCLSFLFSEQFLLFFSTLVELGIATGENGILL